MTPGAGRTQHRHEESGTTPLGASSCSPWVTCSCCTRYSQARTFSLTGAGARAAAWGRRGLATALSLSHLFPSFAGCLQANHSGSNSEHTENSYIPSSFTRRETSMDSFGLFNHKMRILLTCSIRKLSFGLIHKNA